MRNHRRPYGLPDLPKALKIALITALALTARLNRVRTRTRYGLTLECSSANSRLHSIFQSLGLRHRW